MNPFSKIADLLKEVLSQIGLLVGRMLTIERAIQSLAQLPAKDRLSQAELAITRHVLASVDVRDVPDLEDMEQNERKAYVAIITAAFSEVERECNMIIEEQRNFTAEKAANDTQMSFGRGGINGVYLVLQCLQERKAEHEQNIKDAQEQDKTYAPRNTREVILESLGLSPEAIGEVEQ